MCFTLHGPRHSALATSPGLCSHFGPVSAQGQAVITCCEKRAAEGVREYRRRALNRCKWKERQSLRKKKAYGHGPHPGSVEGKGCREEERQGWVSSCREAEAVENKDFTPDDLDPHLSPLPKPVRPTDPRGVQCLCLGHLWPPTQPQCPTGSEGHLAWTQA